MVTLQSCLKKEIENIIDNFLTINNLVDINSGGYPISFLGGSQRFKFNTFMSDIDLFYYTSKAENVIQNVLYRNNFSKIESYQEHVGISSTNTSMCWYHKTLNVHIILINDFSYYQKLEKEHIEVSKYLDKNPEVLEFIKELKSRSPIKGKFIYKSLLKMI